MTTSSLCPSTSATVRFPAFSNSADETQVAAKSKEFKFQFLLLAFSLFDASSMNNCKEKVKKTVKMTM